MKAGGEGDEKDEMDGWHHHPDGHGFEQISGVGDEQGNLVHCCLWDRTESDMTERLNWTEYNGIK